MVENAKSIQNNIVIKYAAYVLGILALIIIPIGTFMDIVLYYDLSDTRFSHWQMPLVFSVCFIFWLGLLYCLLKKHHIFTLVIVVFYLFFISRTFYSLSDFKLIRQTDICDDMEYCVEGIRDWVTREDCESKNKAWNTDDNACQYRFDLKDCYKLEGNWQYPKACDQ